MSWFEELHRTGDEAFGRFTDDLASDSRVTGGVQVAIDATVSRDDSLDWYYTLEANCPNISGEMKSGHALEAFESLGSGTKTKVWSGLARVVLHLADPRPYMEGASRVLSEATSGALTSGKLRALASEGRGAARKLLKAQDEYVGRTMLWDSVPHQLRSRIASADREALVAPDVEVTQLGEWVERDLSELRRGRKSLIAQAAAYSAKGSAALYGALESSDAPFHTEDQIRYLVSPGPEALITSGTLRELRARHAFDPGDRSMLNMLESRRRELEQDLVKSAHRQAWGFTEVSVDGGRDGPAYEEVDSATDARIRAADVTCGFARQTLERQGLAAVVKRWERVYLNGARVTVRNLESHLALWGHL